MEISKFEAESMISLVNTIIQNLCFLLTLHGQWGGGGDPCPLAYVMYGKSAKLLTTRSTSAEKHWITSTLGKI